MWIRAKIDNKRGNLLNPTFIGNLLNPTFIGEGWQLQCDDLDGSRLIILANRDPSPMTVVRNMRRLIRFHKLPIELGGYDEVYYDQTIFKEGGGLQKSAEMHVSWKNEPLIIGVDLKVDSHARSTDERIIAENHSNG